MITDDERRKISVKIANMLQDEGLDIRDCYSVVGSLMQASLCNIYKHWKKKEEVPFEEFIDGYFEALRKDLLETYRINKEEF